MDNQIRADQMSYSVEAYLNGVEDAERDIAEGRLAIEIFVGPWSRGSGASMLKERFGIETKIVGSDLVFVGEREHAEGYNEIMRAEIERRFGADVIEKAEAEAEANWKPTPPMSNWHAVWLTPACAILLLMSVIFWPLSHLVAWIRQKRSGCETVYRMNDVTSIRHWDEYLTRFVERVFERFLN